MKEDHNDLVGTAHERADARGSRLEQALKERAGAEEKARNDAREMLGAPAADAKRLAEAVMKLPLTVEQRKVAAADLIGNFGEAHREAVERALGLQPARKPEEAVSPQRPAHASLAASASVLGAPLGSMPQPLSKAHQAMLEKTLAAMPKTHNLMHVDAVAAADVEGVKKAFQSYGDSWKKRGGAGAFMVTARKWDRLENFLQSRGYDIFAAAQEDSRAEGIIDDIRDLRRYLLLWEAELIARGTRHGASRDNK